MFGFAIIMGLTELFDTDLWDDDDDDDYEDDYDDEDEEDE